MHTNIYIYIHIYMYGLLQPWVPEWCELAMNSSPSTWAWGEYRANIRDYQNMLINQVRWAAISHKKDLFQRNGVYWDIIRIGRDESELRGCEGFLKIVNLGWAALIWLGLWCLFVPASFHFISFLKLQKCHDFSVPPSLKVIQHQRVRLVTTSENY